MELLITLLIYILIFALVYFLVEFFMNSLGVAPKLQGIVKAILALIALVFLLSFLFGGVDWPRVRFK